LPPFLLPFVPFVPFVFFVFFVFFVVFVFSWSGDAVVILS